MAVIGIDLGTTNSLVSYWKDGKAQLISDELGNQLFPSVVSFFEDNKVAVGVTAKEQLVLRPDCTIGSFKRFMGSEKVYTLAGKEYKPLELSAYVLAELKRVAQKQLGEDIEEAVITVPAYFNDKQRSDTKKAAQIAGLKVERLINEPSSAALAYQMKTGISDNNLIVFDFGGGTLDLSYVECFENVIEIVAVAGDNMLGGDDVDAAIFAYICEQKGMDAETMPLEERAALCREIEEQKKLLQEQDSVMIAGVELSNDTLFASCVPLFTKIKKIFLRLLEDADVRISEVDDIIMVGGSSRLTIVKRFLTELLGKEPIVLGDTDKVVAYGAGAYAGMRQRKEEVKDIIMTDVCPFTLGIETRHGKNDEKGYMLPLIRRNSTLPSRTKQALVTLYDYQQGINVKIFQGEEYYAKDNLFLGEVSIDVESKPAGQEMITVQFTYDINGILQVEVENSAGEKKHIMLANQSLTERELERYQAQMQEAVRMVSPWEDEETMELFSYLMKTYEESTGEKQERIGAFLYIYSKKLESGRMKRIHEAVQEMRELVAALKEYEEEKENIYFDGLLKYDTYAEDEFAVEWENDEEGEKYTS